MDKGYVLYRNFIDNYLYEQMNKNMLSNDNIHYLKYDSIIHKTLSKLSDHDTQFSDTIATKYRVSTGNNNSTSNSTDASAFHRDLNLLCNTKTPDIYTFVIYLDNAQLEIIPYSHKTFAIKKLHYPISIQFNPGDAILFNAACMHRGRFENQISKSRKCIQIFEIYKNKEEFNRYSSKILTLPGHHNRQYEFIAQFWYKIPFLKNYLTYKNNSIVVKKKKFDQLTQYHYISTEGQRPRTNFDVDKGNLYRLIHVTNDSKLYKDDYNDLFVKPLILLILTDLVKFTMSILLLALLYRQLSDRSQSVKHSRRR